MKLLEMDRWGSSSNPSSRVIRVFVEIRDLLNAVSKAIYSGYGNTERVYTHMVRFT